MSDAKPRAELTEKPKEDGGVRDPGREIRQAQPYLNAVSQFTGGILGGWLGGYFLDKWLHTSPWGLLVLGTLGTVGGLISLVRELSRLETKKK